MANTTFANLKIGALRRAGNNYNASDSTRLTIAGGIINDCLSVIQAEVISSHYFYDLNNSVSCVAAQAYVTLVDTDILDILNVYQLDTDTKLKKISRRRFVDLAPDTTAYTGIPDVGYAVTSALNVSGQNIFSLYLFPTPSGTTTLYYDYIKNIRFSQDGTGADTEYSPFPKVFDELLYAMFRPRFYSIIAPENTARLTAALAQEEKAKATFYEMLKGSADDQVQVKSVREDRQLKLFRVANSGT